MSNNSYPEPPFVIRCISEECTVIHADGNTYSADAIQDEIAKGTDFGKKLAQARKEVMELV